MNPYEHAQQPAAAGAPSGLPIAGAPPPAYSPNQEYGTEHTQPVAYEYSQAPPQAAPAHGYEQTYQQAAPSAYPQAPAYQQHPPQMPAAYQQTPAYQQQPLQMPAAYQPGPPRGGWGMPPDGPPAYIITPGAMGPVVKKSGAGKKLALVALVALLVAGGGGAFAADSWAKGEVCDAVRGFGDGTGKSSGKKGGSVEQTVAALDAAEKALNSRANLLFFHGDLKEATHDLADDADTLKTMVAEGNLDDRDAKSVTRLLALAASVDNHARRAQRACGLPEKSLLGTTA